MGGTHGLANNQKNVRPRRVSNLMGNSRVVQLNQKKHLEILKSQGVFEML